MTNVVHFQFRLAPGSSVGPVLLRQIWAQASGTQQVEVSRSPRHNADGHLYFLSAPPHLKDPAEVELRLRSLLLRHIVGAVNSLIRIP